MPASTQFGINGFGRIGRTAFRVWWQYHRDQITLKLINTSGSMELDSWVHLLRFDSNYGVFNQPIDSEIVQTKDQASDENPLLGYIKIGGYKIAVTAQREPSKIPWGAYGVGTVIDSTGAFIKPEKAQGHLQAGAQKVIISAPAKGDGADTIVIGVNQDKISQPIRSNASCTTNCIAPVVKVIHERFGILKAMMSTVHSYTDDQNVQDNSHKDLRRARAASENIIPTSTGAATATTLVIPELKGLFDGLAIRVPTPVGSLCDMTFLLAKNTTIEEINSALIQASQESRFQGILAVTKLPIVSRDIIGRRESSIVDLSLTNVVDGNLVKIISWYDNEWGYCNRLIEQVAL